MTNPASAIALLQEMDDAYPRIITDPNIPPGQMFAFPKMDDPTILDFGKFERREINGLENIARTCGVLHGIGEPEIEHDFAKQHINVRYAAGPTIQVTDQLLAQTNEGAFMRAFKQEMEDAMNDYKATTNRYYIDPPNIIYPDYNPVKNAKAALKRAKAAEKADRKQAKAARRIERQRAADVALALDTLRDICEDVRKYSSDARVEAAKELLSRVA